MKKNKPLRAAGILLLATMLTTCMTAGTFAKYTTGAEAEDSARVAKFGVVVTADGTLFGEEYAAYAETGGTETSGSNQIISYSDDTNTGTVQVSTQGTNVVAPGTRNDTGLGFSINGTPEVDVAVGSEVETENIYLKQGSYGVMVETKSVTAENFASSGDLYTFATSTYTKVDTLTATFDENATYYKLHDAATLADDYYPVVYTLTGNTSYNSGSTASDSLAAIEALLENKLATTTYQANTDLSDTNAINLGSEVLTWEWTFSQNDGADTILGDLAAGSAVVKTTDNGATYNAPTDGTDYNLTTSFNITLSVTQID